MVNNIEIYRSIYIARVFSLQLLGLFRCLTIGIEYCFIIREIVLYCNIEFKNAKVTLRFNRLLSFNDNISKHTC